MPAQPLKLITQHLYPLSLAALIIEYKYMLSFPPPTPAKQHNIGLFESFLGIPPSESTAQSIAMVPPSLSLKISRSYLIGKVIFKYISAITDMIACK